MGYRREEKPEMSRLCNMTLRFDNSRVEAAFLNQRMDLLLRLTTWLIILAGVLVGATWFRCLYQKSKSTGMAADHHLVTCYAMGANMLLLFLFFVCLRMGWLTKCLGPARMEVAITSILTITLCASVMFLPVYIAHFQGMEMEEVHGQDTYASDSQALLTIQTLVTTSHLGLPVRWIMMLPVEVASVSVYAAMVFIVGSPEPMDSALTNLVLLSGLVCVFALGKRYDELRERKAFMQIVQERSLRCGAEFELSQMNAKYGRGDLGFLGTASADTQSRPESIPTSVPTATMSEQIWNGDATDVSAQLGRVAEVCDAEHWRIRRDELAIMTDEVLGQGGFGLVAKGVFCGMAVAVKFPKSLKDAEKIRVSDLCNELRIMRYLRHPNIVTMHGAIVEPGKKTLALVMELVHGSVLTKFLLKGEEPNVNQRYSIMLGVCRALLYMHTRVPHIVHGDLKGGNVMVETGDGGVLPKLLDFGLSRVITRQARPLGGTLAWLAPEVLQGVGPPRCSADVYSLGRLLAFVATSLPPLQGQSERTIRRSLRQNKLPLPIWPNGCAFEITCKPLVHACLASEEGQRPSVVEVHRKLLHLPEEMSLPSPDPDLLQHVPMSMASEQSSPQSRLSSEKEPVIPMEPKSARLPSLPEEEMVTGEPASSSKISMQPQVTDPQDTCLMAMEATLLQAVCRWKWSKPPGACCEEHARFRHAQELCAAMLARPCIGDPLPQKGSQCPNCAVLGVEDYCDICGCPCQPTVHEV